MAGGESHTFFLRRTIAGRFLGAHPKRSSTTSKTILRKGRLYTSKKEPATVSGADTCSSGTASVNSLRSVPMVRRLLHQQDYVVVFFFFFQWHWTLFWARERTRGSVRTSSLSTTAFSGSCLAVVAYANALQSSHHSHHAIRLQLL